MVINIEQRRGRYGGPEASRGETSLVDGIVNIASASDDHSTCPAFIP